MTCTVLFEKKISLNDDENSKIKITKKESSHPSKMFLRYHDNIAKFSIHRNIFCRKWHEYAFNLKVVGKILCKQKKVILYLSMRFV